MDEFLLVLIAGIVIVGVMLLVGIPLGEWTGVLQPADNQIAHFESLGRVGLAEADEVSRTITFGSFAVGETNTQTLETMPSFTVSTSLLGGEDSKKFRIDVDQGILSGLRKVNVGFNINDDPGKMSECSNLIMRWNDRSFFSKVPKLYHYDVAVEPDYVKTSNTLEFLGGTPPITCWGWNTMYTLDDMEVTAEYGPEKLLAFDIYSNELESWDMGRLKFYTTTSQEGKMTILLNGREIYSETDPENLETIELEYSDISDTMKVGNNILAFKSNDVFAVDNAVLELYLSTNDVVQEKDFQVTQEDMDAFTEGNIIFIVDEIHKDGILKIRINGNEMGVQSVREGNNTVSFEKSDLVEGGNTVSFMGSGSWDISEVNMTIF